MLLARIVCSDPDCTEELEVAVEDLDELEGFVCECGHGFVLFEISRLREPGGALVAFPERRAATRRRAA